MIDCIFTLDYEIYGNGTGTLKDLVYEPAKQLRDIFNKWNARFVNFVEVAELEKIDAYCTDPAIDLVKKQVRELYQEGFEIALHLHPQWCNARYVEGRWVLDYSEYNLCTLPRPRIARIAEASLKYLRYLVDWPDFTPLSFRAGNWLFQPTETAAHVLGQKGIRIDSSVFKGGRQRNTRLDYRDASRNGYYWSFDSDVTRSVAAGRWFEIPIYTEMVPFWKMPTSKRLGLGNSFGLTGQNAATKVKRMLDFMRFRYPLKLDFTRMTLKELTSMVGRIIRQDQNDSAQYKPIVAIGHTKDLVDPQTVDAFLSFLRTNGVTVSTFKDVYAKLSPKISQISSAKV